MWKIVLDFDSTIADSADCIIRKMSNYRNWRPDELLWDFAPYGNEEERKQMVNCFQSFEFWLQLRPVKGIKNWLKKQYEEGIPIFICSRRTNDDFNYLMSWCKAYDIDQYISDYIFITKSYNKTFLIDDTTIIIDDKPDCIYDTDLGQRILFGNYGYANVFIEKNGLNGIERVPDWESMPNWKLTDDKNIIRV